MNDDMHETMPNASMEPFPVSESMPILPLRNVVFFPGQIMPLFVGRHSSVRLIDEAYRAQTPVLVLTQKDSAMDVPGISDLYDVGTVVRVLKIYTMPDSSKSVVVQGQHRGRVTGLLREEPYLIASVVPLEDEPLAEDEVELEAMMVNIRGLFKKLAELETNVNPEQLNILVNTQDPGAFSFLVATMMGVPVPEKQGLLETHSVKERLNLVTIALSGHIQRLELSQRIQSEVQDTINRSQREYFLREQLRAIRKELGEDNDRLELDEMKEKIAAAGMPEEAKSVADKELSRLSMMNPASAEYTVARSYLDWLLEMPWSTSTEDNLDIAHVREVLDADHHGLGKVKKRILEYLAVRKLKQDMRGPILCFVGPPGVGKTSLGRSIAHALGRRYVRFSLGGVRDEAEIRGHRRTYIGALPGRVIQSLKKAGSNNPVMVLDEIDKVGTDFRGDPSSALLEVLDPEQNFAFSDHYLEVPVDLSRVMFIATANMLEPIPPALRDRMEIIEIPSYVMDEKIQIARRHLLPKQREEHGLGEDQLDVSDEILAHLVEHYTREPGVRTLERKLADICRGVAQDIVEGKTERVSVTEDDCSRFITSRKFHAEVAERIDRPGIATGLAWTPVGGDILFIEATRMKGKGGLIVTGKLGEVMKESIQAAMSYIAANATALGVEENFKDGHDIHVHVPAGAVPKDGPSAGVTMLAALTSLLTGRPVRNDTAMTGEITLRGAVLPVGGIKEKVLAAHRANITRIILPTRNEDDISEIPENVRNSLEFLFVSEMKDVLDLALREREKEPDSDEAGANTEKTT